MVEDLALDVLGDLFFLEFFFFISSFLILSLSLFVLSGLDSFGGKESSKKLHSYLVPSLDKLDRHLLPRGAVGAELDEAKGAGVEGSDLDEWFGGGF